MAFISRLRIEGLNGRTTVNIPIHNRHCILVGPNGSGKSTALLVLAYALGRQWAKLATLRFSKLELQFDDGKAVSLTRDACAAGPAAANALRSGSIQRYLVDANLFEDFLVADLSSPSYAKYFSDVVRIPPTELRSLQRTLRGTRTNRAAEKELAEFAAALDSAAIPPVLYLPTYRRIELEINKAIEQIHSSPRFRPRGASPCVVLPSQS